jgi:hypothetical protein
LNASFHMWVEQSWRRGHQRSDDQSNSWSSNDCHARAAPEKLNATLSSTTAKRLKAVVLRGSMEEETIKASKLRWWRI